MSCGVGQRAELFVFAHDVCQAGHFTCTGLDLKSGLGWALQAAGAMIFLHEGAVSRGAPAAKTKTSLVTGVGETCLNSFTGDTPVLMADGSTKPIKNVRLGARVMATDPITGERGPRRVLDLIRHSGQHTMVAVRLGDGSTIDATDHHLFWVANRGAWVDAIDLRSGDQVETADGGLLVVESIGVRVEDLRAFNLTVNDLHTYYAGDDEVLVHNAGCMSSLIGNDPFLVRAAESAGKSPQVQREMDALFAQLSAGNTRSLSGTGISYARSRGGARLFFRNVDGGIQIVGKASKANESSVINYLLGLYGP
jgi:hypothetical protein